jgi:putative RNA 2'-phosphotransferase
LNLKPRVSKYMSLLLRHSPQNLRMDAEGFVSIDELLEKIRTRYLIDKSMILEIADKSDKKRFEVKGNKIRALYGHTINVNIEFEEDTHVKLLYHGTTLEAASKILKEGLKPMKRRWVHLSPTVKTALEIGKRRTAHPVVLEIDVKAAREDGMKLYRATGKVFLSESIPSKYIKMQRKRSQDCLARAS